MFPTPRKRTAARSLDGAIAVHQRSGKRRQHNSPYVSQGNACCSICLEQAVQLVQLGACTHAVCRGCMAGHLLHAFKLAHLPLRCPLPHCKARLRLQPALQLMEQQIPGSKSIAAKVLLAGADPLSAIPDDLCFACPYADCQVPMELELQQLPDMPSDCPACQRPICTTCKTTWHSGLLCAQYQALAGCKQSKSCSGSNSSSFSCQPHKQHVPFISAGSDFSNKWQQQQQKQQQQQHWQQQQHIRPPQSNVPRSAGAPAGGWVSGRCSPLHIPDLGYNDQDGMAWSPSKNM